MRCSFIEGEDIWRSTTIPLLLKRALHFAFAKIKNAYQYQMHVFFNRHIYARILISFNYFSEYIRTNGLVIISG